MAELERAQLAFGGVRQAARILKTESGNAIPGPPRMTPATPAKIPPSTSPPARKTSPSARLR